MNTVVAQLDSPSRTLSIIYGTSGRSLLINEKVLRHLVASVVVARVTGLAKTEEIETLQVSRVKQAIKESYSSQELRKLKDDGTLSQENLDYALQTLSQVDAALTHAQHKLNSLRERFPRASISISDVVTVSPDQLTFSFIVQ